MQYRWWSQRIWWTLRCLQMSTILWSTFTRLPHLTPFQPMTWRLPCLVSHRMVHITPTLKTQGTAQPMPSRTWAQSFMSCLLMLWSQSFCYLANDVTANAWENLSTLICHWKSRKSTQTCQPTQVKALLEWLLNSHDWNLPWYVHSLPHQHQGKLIIFWLE